MKGKMVVLRSTVEGSQLIEISRADHPSKCGDFGWAEQRERLFTGKERREHKSKALSSLFQGEELGGTA